MSLLIKTGNTTTTLTPSLGLCSAQLLKQQTAKYTSCLALAVADGLFDLCGSKRTDELFMGAGPPPPTPHFPVPSKPYGFCGRKAPCESGDDIECFPGEKPETSATDTASGALMKITTSNEGVDRCPDTHREHVTDVDLCPRRN